ncbi:MAG TPA: DUF692 domain-containing protein [Burkholderiaceae bacterium]|jgi:hypothetical protein
MNKLDIHTPRLGLGLREVHFDDILSNWPAVDWFEIISESFMRSGGRPRHVLQQIAERYPIAMHGVSLSIGSTDPLDLEYLHALKQLAMDVDPLWISDHLCWTGILGSNTHDLLPVPLTEQCLKHIAARIRTVQNILERPLILENPASYMSYVQSDISEPDFLRMLTEETGCGLLLDVNNAYITCFNNDLDPQQYIAALPAQRIVQMHLAGYRHHGTHIVDTHDGPVAQPVWDLFQFAWQHARGVPVLLEWDSNIPPFEVYHAEVMKARSYMRDGKRINGEADNVSGKSPQLAAAEPVANPARFILPEVQRHIQLVKGIEEGDAKFGNADSALGEIV